MFALGKPGWFPLIGYFLQVPVVSLVLCDEVPVVYVDCEQVEGREAVKDPVYCAAEDLLHVLR